MVKIGLLDRLVVGESVNLVEKDGRYTLAMFPGGPRPLSHTVVAVGTDHVVLRDVVGVTDTVVPVYSIQAITVLRIGVGK